MNYCLLSDQEPSFIEMLTFSDVFSSLDYAILDIMRDVTP